MKLEVVVSMGKAPKSDTPPVVSVPFDWPNRKVYFNRRVDVIIRLAFDPQHSESHMPSLSRRFVQRTRPY